jgi:hypothetical protein
MFDLEREVAAWSAAVYAERCRSSAGEAELSDHLYCEIDRARAAGLSDEEAFRTAVARLGSPAALTAEHAKNRSALGTVCQVAAKLDGNVTAEQRGLLLGHAVIWASLILASSLFLSKSTVPTAFSLLLMGGFVPLWWASEQLLRRAMRQRSR